MNIKLKIAIVIVIIAVVVSAFLILSAPAKQESIKIGSILSLTGKMSNYGKSSKAAMLAMNDVLNKERKEKGYPSFDLIFEDDKLEAKNGVAAALKLIDKDNVSVIIGAQPSYVTLAIAPIAESKKRVIISPASTSSDMTFAGDYIFRTVLSGEYEGKISAELYNKYYKGKKLAVLYINNEYGVNMKKVFLSSVGIADVLEVAYSEKDIDFKTYLTKIKNEGIEVVYIIGYNEMVEVFKQAKKLGLIVNWLGTATMGDQSLVDKLGSTADGAIFPYWEMDLDEIKIKKPEFYSLFLKYSNNAELDAYAANAVDALLILNSIINDRTMTGEEIKDKLYKIRNFDGITGKISFDKNGDVIKNLLIKTIKNGKIENYN